MNCCKDCKYHCRLDEIKVFSGYAQVIFKDGFVCTQRLPENGKVAWYSESDDNTYHCDNFESR